MCLQRKLLENKLSENLVFKEFEEIPKKVQSAECSVARLPENEIRNRFKDVLPYDITRVKLTPRKDNHSGYINGSHIKVRTTKLLKYMGNFFYYGTTQLLNINLLLIIKQASSMLQTFSFLYFVIGCTL